MTEIRVATGYVPRPLQAKLHKSLDRFTVLVCHRRFGKTVFCINELIDRALSNKGTNPRLAYIAPLYKQAKTVAWDYLKHYTAAIPGRQVNESELRVDLPNGSRISLYGADNPDSLRGIYLDGVVLDEYAQMSPRLWGQVIRPALADRKGWAIFIGTPMGHNEFWRIYEYAKSSDGWFAAMFKASETGVLEPDELIAAASEMDEDEYDQEFECSFTAAIKGAYFGKLMAKADADGRIAGVPYDPVLPVHTAWDLGIGDDNVIWFFQQSGPRIQVIDYYANHGFGVDHYWQELQRRARDDGYVYGTHYAPHDIEAREWGTGRTREEQSKRLGLKFIVVARVSNKEDGHNAVRAILPRCYFDEKKCEDGIEAMRQYRREWDEKKQAFKDRPLHDWTSHPADAFQTMALGVKDQYAPPEPRWERNLNEELLDHFKRSESSERI